MKAIPSTQKKAYRLTFDVIDLWFQTYARLLHRSMTHPCCSVSGQHVVVLAWQNSSKPEFHHPITWHSVHITSRCRAFLCELPRTSPFLWSQAYITSLRSSPTVHEDIATDVETCIRYLAGLEHIWAGARRSRLILEELLKRSREAQSIWDIDAFGTDDITGYMLRQESVGFDFDFDSFGAT